ncbi:hypothetical protein HYH03_017005 [Edaphochlamys debaryana]|uniref:Protein kinase domain-containing protein n=1 Tax=Edaphochlamys debaryana TaxID=47281 RepID=A0A835XJY0_9CHLO|nr:hypothetical protein HYH03_017005 [Edaphochlamys debaryana]|eukprot:KAG2484193.1 hypothetical protein HYH03_017005 [Edaphochlamys debaryana]
MQAFEYLSTLGEGAYGEVWKCLERASGRTVAIKGFKQAHEDRDIMRLAVREAKMLRSLDHPNLVFEFVGPSVHDELHLYPSGLPPSVMKLVTWQLLRAAAHLHSKKVEEGTLYGRTMQLCVLHRDIKPANVLLQHDPAGGPPAAKLCDFGFARGTQCGPREAQRCTSYCVTRWYRAPEILVGDMYGPSSDVWSIGCTIAEAATGSPLFSGESTLDQLYRLMRCFGALPPRQAALIEASPRLRPLAAGCPPGGRTRRQRLPALEPRLLELIEACLKPDPSERPTAAELLQMPYFWDVPRLVAGTHMEAWVGAHATCAQQQGPAQTPQHQAPPPARSLVTAALVDAESEACAMAKPPAAAYGHAEAEAGTPGAMPAVRAEAAAQSAPPSGDASHPRPAAGLRAACPRTAVPVTVAVAAARAGPPHLFMTEPLDACPSGELASPALNYLTLTGVVRVRDPASDSSQATARDQSWASVVPAGVSPCVREGPPSSRLRECSSSSIFNMWRRSSAMGGAEELNTPLNAPQLQAPPPGTHLPDMPRSLQLCRPGPVEEGEEGAPGAADAPGPAVLSTCDDGEAAGAHEARDGAGNTNSLGRSLRSAARVLGQRILTFSGGVPGAPFSRRSLAAGGAAPMSVASSRPHSGSFRSGLFVRRSFGLRGRSERLADEDCPQGAAPCNQPGMSAPTTQELPRDSQADAVHIRTTALPYVSAAVPSSALDRLAADAPRLLSLVVNRLPPPASPIQTVPLQLYASQQPRQGAGPHATPDGRRDLGQAVLQGPTAQGRVAAGAAVQGGVPAVASAANSAALAAAALAVEVTAAPRRPSGRLGSPGLSGPPGPLSRRRPRGRGPESVSARESGGLCPALDPACGASSSKQRWLRANTTRVLGEGRAVGGAG